MLSNCVNTSAVAILLTLYIFSTAIGKRRVFTGLFLMTSLVSFLIYNISLCFLTTKLSINRIQLELEKTLDAHYSISYNRYTVDAVLVMLTALRVSDIFFVSTIFLCISHTAYSPALISNKSRLVTSIIALSRIWAVIRIPIAYYSPSLINDKVALFLTIVASSVETVIASLFAISMRFKNSSTRSPNLTFFSLAIFLYGFLKYSVNLVDLPFKIDDQTLEIVFSLQFSFTIALYLLMTGIITFRDNVKTVPQPVNIEKEIEAPCVALVETIIEFDEQKNSLLK